MQAGRLRYSEWNAVQRRNQARTNVDDRRGFATRAVLGDAVGWGAAAFRIAFYPQGQFYGLTVRFVNLLRSCRILREKKLSAPVISVGNISLGGTGKTPMVEWVAKWLMEHGRNPAILSRGYGAAVAEGVNEEAALLRENLAETPHYRNPERYAAGLKALADGADCLVLDDGFQHRQLHRDMDVVLVDALSPPNHDYIFPCGSLREPVSALKRAHIIVLTRVDLVEPEAMRELREFVKRRSPAATICEAVHKPISVDYVDAGASVRSDQPDSLRGKKIYGFCGIGNPDGFRRTLTSLKANVTGMTYFADHFAYGPNDIAEVAEAARNAGAELVVTTQKDAVKVRGAWQGTQLATLRTKLEIVIGAELLQRALDEVIER
jgi:tetraacyldisaccharide 4'-kinase